MNNNNSAYSQTAGSSLALLRGVLEVWFGDEHVWTAPGQTSAGTYVTLQTDGNLVVYNSSNNAVWAANTSWDCGPITCYLDIQNDGNVVIYRDIGAGDYQSVWATGTLLASA